MNNSDVLNSLWAITALLRGVFRADQYQDVTLPLAVLRRHGFEKPSGDSSNLAADLRNHLGDFSPEIQDILEKFDFSRMISMLDEAGLLRPVLEQIREVDLHPDRVSPQEMGEIFDELVRRHIEALGFKGEEHFTPPDVSRFMAEVLLTGDESRVRRAGSALTFYDPCCGTGQLLTAAREQVPPDASVQLSGQEVNPRAFAICKARLLLRSEDGSGTEAIAFGSTLSNDRHAGARFDYLLAQPPFGLHWKADQERVTEEHAQGFAGRFGAGLPRVSDGQLLFLQHMLSHMKPPETGGSRMVILTGRSPLFAGGAGSGESEIRRWIVENDWIEALIALPAGLFLDAGLPTCLWVLTNRKPAERQGRILLFDAENAWAPLRKPQGMKRRLIPPEWTAEISAVLKDYKEGEHSRILPAIQFGFRMLFVERSGEHGKPLRSTELAPLAESPEEFFRREIQPYAPDARLDASPRDPKDGGVGLVRYDLGFGDRFKRQRALRPSASIASDLLEIERSVLSTLEGLASREPVRLREPAPSSWTKVKLGYLIEILGGGVARKEVEEEGPGEIAWVFPQDLRSRLLTGASRQISRQSAQEAGLRLIEPPAILFNSRTMAQEGSWAPTLATVPVVLHQDVKAIQLSTAVDPIFFLHLLEAIESTAPTPAQTSLAGLPRARQPPWQSIKASLPPLDEQRKLARLLEDAADEFDRLEEKMESALDLLKNYRKALVSDALAGVLEDDNTGPEDGTA